MNEMGLADSRFKVPHTIVRRFGDLLTDADIRRLQETYGYPIRGRAVPLHVSQIIFILQRR